MINTGFQKSLTGLQSKMLSFAYTLTSNRDDAQDLTQDTTLKALTNEKKYATNINFKGWVFTIMRNIFINGYRRKARSGVISETADAPARIDLAQDSSAESPEDVYGAKEITQAINTFPEEYRRPFAMHIAGYKYSEIAEKTGLPLGTVKSRIYAHASVCRSISPITNKLSAKCCGVHRRKSLRSLRSLKSLRPLRALE